MKVYEAMASALAEEGLDIAFSVSGYGNLDLIIDLTQKWDVKYIAARHENGAVAMADAYARVTGQPALCSVTQGPGLTNTPMALTTAVRHRSPVILLAGDAPRDNRHDIQTLNQRALVEAIGAKFVPIRTPATVAEDIQTALRHARLGLGPAVIDAHVDVQNLDVEGEFSYTHSAGAIPAPQRVHPDPDVIAQATEVLRRAERPVLLAGRGAVESDAREAMVTLAEADGALLATTFHAKDLFRGHPNTMGVAGGLATEPAVDFLTQTDCIVAVGAGPNAWTTVFGLLFPNSPRLIQIDAAAERIGSFMQPDVAVVADARAAVEALNAALGATDRAAPRAEWVQRARTRLEEAKLQPEYWIEADDGLDPRAVVAHLDRLLPQDRTVVMDGGPFLGFLSVGLSVPEPSGFVFSQDFGAVGLGIALGIGAALAAPDRDCVTVVGHGGFMMSLQEVETAARYRIPMTLVIMNDGAYGGELVQLAARRKPVSHVLFESPDLAEVARALGAEGKTVESLDDLRVVNDERGDVPLVLDVKTSRQVVHGFVEEFTTKASWEDE